MKCASTQILAALLFIGLFLPQGAVGETQRSARSQKLIEYYRSLPPQQRKAFLKKMRARRRTLASNNSASGYSSMRAQRSARPENKDISLSLNILAGMSFVNGSESDETGELVALSDQSINAAVDANVTLFKYLGLEADAQLGFASAQESQSGNDAVFTQIRHRSASAAMLNLNGQLPLNAGSLTFIPNAGVGYGALFVTDETEFASSDDSSSDSNHTVLSGAYWTVGLDAQIDEKWRIGLDFSQSVNASGKITFSNDDSELRLQDSAFNRLRLGASYQITPQIRVGAQFIRRSMSYVFPIQDQGNIVPLNAQIDQNHVLALIGFDL